MTVDVHTGEIVAHMSADSARESVERAKRGLEAAADEIVRQINGRAWLSLGYESWDEMREAEYAGAAVIVPRADRPQLVARLRAEGLSQKEIGGTVGVSDVQVGRDLRNQQMSDTEPTIRTDSLGRERPTSYTPRQSEPEVVDAEVVDDEPETPLPPLPRPTPEAQARLDREALRESELRAARTNLRSVLTYLTSTVLKPDELADDYADVLGEFDPADLDFAAQTMAAIAQRSSHHG